jgi:hypothetical protein
MFMTGERTDRTREVEGGREGLGDGRTEIHRSGPHHELISRLLVGPPCRRVRPPGPYRAHSACVLGDWGRVLRQLGDLCGGGELLPITPRTRARHRVGCALAEGRFIFGFAMAASAWAFRPRSILIEPEGLTVKRWLGGIRRFAWENVRVFPGRRPEFGRFTYQGRGPGYFLLSLNQFNAL